MPTFKSKSKIVDARHFTGGPENAIMLVQWIKAHGGFAIYEMKIQAGDPNPLIREEIRIVVDEDGKKKARTAELEDWIVLDNKGLIKPCPPNKFWDEYEEV